MCSHRTALSVRLTDLATQTKRHYDQYTAHPDFSVDVALRSPFICLLLQL